MPTSNIIALVLISLGCIVLVLSAWRYYRFIRYSRAESYADMPITRNMQTALLCLMLFFIVGYSVGIIDVLRRDVEPIYVFVGVVFFLGALFVAFMVQAQITLADSLRGKTMEVMRGFVNSIEMKDPYTQGHSWHVYHIVETFCCHLPAKTRAGLNVPKLLDAALLHDIGKMGVNNDILNKRGPLSEAEWVEIKTHPSHGRLMLENTCFSEIGDWVLYHHERVDGAGYLGIPGADIPLEARIITVADTYSAMTTDREYRPKRSHAEAVEIMREVAGSQLDAELVEAFAAIDEAELVGLVAKALGSVSKPTSGRQIAQK